jgi:hypothetical protein
MREVRPGDSMTIIRTWYEHPPIPLREFDYGAVCDGYEGGDPIGWGRTEDEAIADLEVQIDEARDG